MKNIQPTLESGIIPPPPLLLIIWKLDPKIAEILTKFLKYLKKKCMFIRNFCFNFNRMLMQAFYPSILTNKVSNLLLLDYPLHIPFLNFFTQNLITSSFTSLYMTLFKCQNDKMFQSMLLK